MTPQTFNALGNSAEIDFDKFTLGDAIEYAEFEEALHSWEQELED